MELKKLKKSRKVIFAILSFFCIVLSFLSPLNSYASSGGSLRDYFDLSSDDFITSSSEYIDSSISSAFASIIDSRIPNLNYNFASNYTYDVSDNYFIYYQGGTGRALYGFISNDSFCNVVSNSLYIFIPDSTLSTLKLSQCSLTNSNYSVFTTSRNGTKVIDGITYSYFLFNKNSDSYNVSTNMPIYNLPSNFSSLNDAVNCNNTPIYNSSQVDYSNLLDHLTLYDNSKMYISASSFNEGTLYIYPIMDDYQKEHSDAFYLRLVGSCSYNVRSNSSADTIVTWGGQKTRDLYNIGQQNKTISSSLSSSSGSYIDIPFNSISGGVVSYSMDFLNNSFPTIYDYRIKPLASSLSTTYDNYITTFSKFISGVKVSGFSIDPTSIYDGDIDIICTDCLYHFDLYVGNGDNISTSPVLSWDSDFVNGTGSSNFDNLSSLEDVQNATGSGSNSLPAEYYFSNDVPSYNNSVSGGGSSSSSSSPSTSTSQGGDSNNNITTGDNNQVVNTGSTNVTVNNDNGTAKYVPTILNKLLPNSEGDGGLSNDVQDLVNSNGWVTFMKTTYSFIPSAFWDKLVLYFGACLTITACAFLLRIILDLL